MLAIWSLVSLPFLKPASTSGSSRFNCKLSPRVCSNSCPLSRCCHPTISSCHPLLLLPSIFPRIRAFSNESVLCNRWPEYWSFSFSISPSNENSGLLSFRLDSFDLLINLSLYPSHDASGLLSFSGDCEPEAVSTRFSASWCLFFSVSPLDTLYTGSIVLILSLLPTFRYLYFMNIIIYCKYCFNTSFTWHFISILTDLWKYNLNTMKFTLCKSQWFLIRLQSCTALTTIQS